MNIGIIEDEQIHKELLQGYLNQWSRETKHPLEIDAFPSAESFLFSWEEKKSYDVLFVDIQMKAMNGMDMAKKIRESDRNVAIIFTTGITDYLEEGYEVEALHYLIKPISEEKVRICMNKVKERNKQKKSLLFEIHGELTKIPEEQIVYIEARGHKTVAELKLSKNLNKMKAVKGSENEKELKEFCTVELNESFSKIEKQLDEKQFVKCHRSYLCNIALIHHIDKESVHMDSGSEIPVSRRAYSEVNQAFIRYYKRER